LATHKSHFALNYARGTISQVELLVSITLAMQLKLRLIIQSML